MQESFSGTYDGTAYDLLSPGRKRMVDSLLERCAEGKELRPIVLEVLSDYDCRLSNDELDELINLINTSREPGVMFAVETDVDGKTKDTKRIPPPRTPKGIIGKFFAERGEEEFRKWIKINPQVAYEMIRGRMHAIETQGQDPEKVVEEFRNLAKFILRCTEPEPN